MNGPDITDITNITSSSYYSMPAYIVLQSENCRRYEMAYYRQTVLIPRPRQNLNDKGKSFGPRNRRSDNTQNVINRDLNSILAFFD